MGVRVRLRIGETVEQGLKRLRRELEKNSWKWEQRKREAFVPLNQEKRRKVHRRRIKARKIRRQ